MTQDASTPTPGAAPAAIAKRLAEWRDKLIDLSRANRLLAFRATKASTLNFVGEDAHEVAKRLIYGRRYSFRGKPESDVHRDPKIAPDESAEPAASDDTAKPQRPDSVLQCDLERARMERILLNLYRASRSTLEEQGFNTLHVALGMFTFTTVEDPRPLRAPLLLIPVELTRRGARGAFRLKLFDGEIRLNPALVVKLRKELGINVSLPEDWTEHEDPMQLVRSAFETLAAGRHGWTVSRDIVLALFSFAKIPLYQDLLQNEETIGSHSMVRSLALGKSLLGDQEIRLPTPDTVEEAMDPADSFQILLADSSQQAAILAARNGVSFVLQGPPGTGKSQTIANMIAECLARGKRVLFVSEKIAALNVVKRRLDKAGLGPFCLEVHSRKANKRDIVRSLASAWKQWAPDQPDATTGLDELRELKETLRTYVDALHAPRGESGYSAFEVFGRAARLHHMPPCPFDVGDPQQATRQSLKDTQRRLEELEPLREAIDPMHRHPWRHVGLTQLGVDTSDKVRRTLNVLLSALDDFDAASGRLGEALNVDPPRTRAHGGSLADIALHLDHSTHPPRAWIEEPNWPGTSPRIRALLESSRSRGEEIASLRTVYDEAVLDLDATQLQSLARPGGFLFGWFRRRRAKKMLAAHLAASKTKRDIDLKRDVAHLAAAARLGNELDAGDGALVAAFGSEYAGARKDLSALEGHSTWIVEAVRLATPALSRSELADLATAEDKRVFRNAADAWATDSAALKEAWNDVSTALELDAATRFGQSPEQVPISKFRSFAESAAASMASLPTWVAWHRAAEDARRAGLGEYLEAFDDTGAAHHRLVDTWFRTFWRAFADQLLKSDSALGAFDATTREKRIERYCALDQQQLQQSCERVARILRTAIPQPTTASAGNSEVSILKREMRKERRHLPTRVLFDRIPRLLRALKPCLMMSPLSVATYLPPGDEELDVVIFDEASQICTEDAIGAISRAKQVIVAGDSKQLPPTRFFTRRFEEDESEDMLAGELADLPSVLDECQAGPLPQVSLKWHYRSLDESLIAFSNQHFYENGLVAFPNADRDPRSLGISFMHVPDGVFHGGRGGSRTNPIEARAVAKRVFEVLKSRPHDSVGVVTFSATQRDAVWDALDALRADDASFDHRFDHESDEPVFVKNLESVQGDERDVILFSVGYARDPEGTFRLLFGPLSAGGGDRRLNVAVTRSRKQVIVYASIQPEDIALERTESRGARLLRAYLEAARRGMHGTAIHDANDASTADEDSPELMRAIVESLTREEVTAAHGIGASAFPVDVAIPDSGSERYALGLLCDGPAYRDAATTRDRERSRAALLRRLGWRVLHIWSPDWLRAPDTAVQRIRAKLAEPTRPILPPPATRETDQANASMTRGEEAKEANDDWLADELEPDDLPGIVDYKAVHLRPQGTAEEFHVVPVHRIRRVLTRVVAAESPVHEDVAARRMAVAWGMSRVSEKTMTRILAAVDDAVARGELERRGAYMWDATARELQPRRPGDGVQRDIDRIAPEEVEAAVLCIVDAHLSLSIEDLLRETGRVFGFARRGPKIGQAVKRATESLVLAGTLIREVREEGTRLSRPRRSPLRPHERRDADA